MSKMISNGEPYKMAPSNARNVYQYSEENSLSIQDAVKFLEANWKTWGYDDFGQVCYIPKEKE